MKKCREYDAIFKFANILGTFLLRIRKKTLLFHLWWSNMDVKVVESGGSWNKVVDKFITLWIKLPI